jgi:CUB domain
MKTLIALGALVCLAGAARAQAPLNCPSGANSWTYVPYQMDSSRFPYASSVPYGEYQNNLDYTWQVWFSGNVTGAEFVFSRFALETNYDYLDISGGYGVHLTGILDNYGTSTYTTGTVYPTFSSANDNYMTMHFHTDVSNNDRGWAIQGIWLYCGRANQPAAPSSTGSELHLNSEREGVLIGTHDIRYFAVQQKANQPLAVHLKQDTGAWNNQDFDLYIASTITTPGPTSGAQYLSARGGGCIDENGHTQMCEDHVLVPATSSDHTVYIGVYSYTGGGGFKLYANNIGKTYQLRADSRFNYKSPDYTQHLKDVLLATAGANYQAGDGTGMITRWDLYNNDPTCGGLGCNVNFWAGADLGAACGYTDVCVAALGCNFSNPGEQVNDCATMDFGYNHSTHYLGMALAHESTHCIYGFPDEYTDAETGFNDGHSIMSGAFSDTAAWPTTDPTISSNFNDWCTSANHLKDPYIPDTDPNRRPANDAWTRARQCNPDQFRSYFVSGTPDPEMFVNSDVWQSWTAIYEH